MRARLATGVGRLAAGLSRATGRGEGSVIGGRVGLSLEPKLLALLASRCEVALISGTNGKTTTTKLICAALAGLGEVATTRFGANLPAGHTWALASARGAQRAVLEVDEHYLPLLLEQTRPKVVVLLNLTRDQMDRAMEVSRIADRWRRALDGASVHVVANADDPLVTWAAQAAAGGITWVAAGHPWREDSWVCPQCAAHIQRADDRWWCSRCDLKRPEPQWTVRDSRVVDSHGIPHDLTLQLPGRVNRANAAMAVAAAARFGVSAAEALPRLAQVTSIAGRYQKVERDGRIIRLLLAKNPAGWLAAFEMAEDVPTLLPLNARGVDGADTSWLYDVDFSGLRDRHVLITGDRAYDLAVRLEVDQVQFKHVETFSSAVKAVPPGRLEVIANYSAFREIRAELGHAV